MCSRQGFFKIVSNHSFRENARRKSVGSNQFRFVNLNFVVLLFLFVMQCPCGEDGHGGRDEHAGQHADGKVTPDGDFEGYLMRMASVRDLDRDTEILMLMETDGDADGDGDGGANSKTASRSQASVNMVKMVSFAFVWTSPTPTTQWGRHSGRVP